MCVVERTIDENGVQIASALGSLRHELAAAVNQASEANGAAQQSGAAVEALNRRILAVAILLIALSALKPRTRQVVTAAVKRVSARSLMLLLFFGLASAGVARATTAASRKLPLVGALIQPLAASRSMQLASYGGALCIYAASAGLPWKLALALFSGGSRLQASG